MPVPVLLGILEGGLESPSAVLSFIWGDSLRGHKLYLQLRFNQKMDSHHGWVHGTTKRTAYTKAF